jgi:cell division protein FtsZ
MLFLTAGMGGGTGTGAAPIIAEIRREKGILTIGVVTNPFSTEGGYRKQYAKEGLDELRKYVDTLLIINNDKLIEVYGDLTLSQAFAKANEVLNTATKGIAEVISQHLLVNIDLNDARKVLENSGTAVMGQAEATGENRAIEAVNAALDSPLLNDNDITGAEQVLLKIVTGDGDDEIKMSELNKIKNKIQEAAGKDVNIIEGIGVDEDLGSAVSVTVIATGFETKKVNEPVTIKLEDSDLEIEDEIENIDTQQKLLLDEESIEFENHIIQENLLSSESETIKTNISLDNDNEIIEKPEEIISDFLEENIEEETSVSNSIDGNEEDLIEFESQSKNTISEEVNISNDQSMKIEAREREERLREISIKLRTPSEIVFFD